MSTQWPTFIVTVPQFFPVRSGYFPVKFWYIKPRSCLPIKWPLAIIECSLRPLSTLMAFDCSASCWPSHYIPKVNRCINYDYYIVSLDGITYQMLRCCNCLAIWHIDMPQPYLGTHKYLLKISNAIEIILIFSFL